MVAGLGVIMVRAEGFAATTLTLASGQAWVASSTVGQIALIDGSTEQKVAAVTVSRPGEQISVTQGGPDALVVNRTTGSLLRIKGSTYDDAPGPVTALEGAGEGLSVYAGRGGEAFAVDSARGTAVVLDRSSMVPRDRPGSLAAGTTDGAADGLNDVSRAGHTYATPGGYTITLTVRDAAGHTMTATRSVTITQPPADDPPVARLTASPRDLVAGQSAEADASASTDDNPGLSYTFDWGDGERTTTGQSRAAHTYAAACNCEIRVTVTDSKGQTDAATATVTVQPDPVADFVGEWQNVDPGTGNVKRVVITRAGGNDVTVHPYGACVGGDCDGWGAKTATVSGGQVVVEYTLSYASYVFRITSDGTNLTVRKHTDFTDADGRTDFDSTDMFTR
jgi:PKD repeat protein